MADTNTAPTVTTGERDVTLSRVFNAPRELVFNAFASCDAIKQWWGPRLWPTVSCDMDFRVGGVWTYCMRGPAGEDACGKATYREIKAPERIVYDDTFTDKDGAVLPDMPTMRIIVEFTERDGKTLLSTRAEYSSEAELKTVLEMGMVAGMTETWERLDEYLARA